MISKESLEEIGLERVSLEKETYMSYYKILWYDIPFEYLVIVSANKAENNNRHLVTVICHKLHEQMTFWIESVEDLKTLLRLFERHGK